MHPSRSGLSATVPEHSFRVLVEGLSITANSWGPGRLDEFAFICRERGYRQLAVQEETATHTDNNSKTKKESKELKHPQ
jgi:hypothetical protein